MTKEEAKAEIRKVFEPAFANYIITALTEGATPSERKTGRRIVITKMDGRTLYECSVCGKRVIFDDLMDLSNYCDHCGAKMEGSEADAEKL